MRRLTVLALALVAALALAACGGGSGGSGGGGSEGKSSGNDPKSLFAGTCGGCHRLNAAGTKGTFGPDLDQAKPSESAVLTAIKTGPGAMPAGLFKDGEADAVAKYVADNAGK